MQEIKFSLTKEGLLRKGIYLFSLFGHMIMFFLFFQTLQELIPSSHSSAASFKINNGLHVSKVYIFWFILMINSLSREFKCQSVFEKQWLSLAGQNNVEYYIPESVRLMLGVTSFHAQAPAVSAESTVK